MSILEMSLGPSPHTITKGLLGKFGSSGDPLPLDIAELIVSYHPSLGFVHQFDQEYCFFLYKKLFDSFKDVEYSLNDYHVEEMAAARIMANLQAALKIYGTWLKTLKKCPNGTQIFYETTKDLKAIENTPTIDGINAINEALNSAITYYQPTLPVPLKDLDCLTFPEKLSALDQKKIPPKKLPPLLPPPNQPQPPLPAPPPPNLAPLANQPAPPLNLLLNQKIFSAIKIIVFCAFIALAGALVLFCGASLANRALSKIYSRA